MTDTRDWADEKATTDVTRWFHDNGFPCDGNDLPALERLYADALRAAARVQPGHVREGDTDRKVLGTLPVTADGCVVGWGDWGMWYLRGNSREVVGPLLVKNDAFGFSGCQQHHSPSDCYSTRAAAEAARTAGEATNP